MLVDVTSPAAIAQGMRSLLKDADLRSTLGRLGRERVLNEWPLEKIAQKYESVLEDAMKEQMC
jgi:glycosyltransferase involved in cell wall biosynthesis